MLDEEGQEADFVVFYLGKFAQDVVGYEVGTARSGGEGEIFLEPGHFFFVLSIYRFSLSFGINSDQAY